jgi:hypothetical protein
VIGEILSNCFVFEVTYLYPIFKILPIILIFLLTILGNSISRIFSIYVGVNYGLIAVLQSVGVSEEYGFGILFTNLIMFLLVAVSWLWDVVIQRNDFTPHKRPLRKYWVIPLALLAFWYPANSITFQPDFNPILFLTNQAGLTFCMMTPVYLAVLTLFYPRVNVVTLRITSLVGIIIGLYNVSLNFIINPNEFWWNGVLHIPLLVISVYGFILSLQRKRLDA